MKFKAPTEKLVLLIFLILSIIVRYPIVFHEKGVDSFYIHFLANSISNFGYAKWIIHPASAFGLYPLSYPSATPMLVSGISQTSDASMETSIFIFSSIFLGFLGFLSTYLLAKEFFDNDLYIFLSAFIFSMAPLFISYTDFTATARGTFIALFPLFIWMLMKFAKTSNLVYLPLAASYLILLAMSHRMSILIPLILFAFVFGLSSVKFELVNKKFSSSYKVNFVVLSSLFLLLLVLQFTGKGFQTPSLEYYDSSFFSGSSPIILLLNTCINYLTGVSPFLILAPCGLVALFLDAAKNPGRERFLALTLIMTVLVLSNKQYGRTFSLIFFSLLVIYSFSKIDDFFKIAESRKKVFCGFLISILLVSTIFSVWLPLYRIKHSSSEIPIQIEGQTYNLGLFMGNNSNNNTFLSNNEIIGTRISAVSKTSYSFPVGPSVLICDLINKEQLNVKEVKLAQFLSSTKTVWELDDWLIEGYYYETRHTSALENHPNTDYEQTIFEEYNFNYLVVRKGSIKYNSLVNRISENEPNIYDNGLEKLWYLENFFSEL